MMEFQPTVANYKQGAHTLPGEYYSAAEFLAEERERIFARSWNCVGRASRIARPGDYVLCDVAGESILVVRDSHGVAHAFFNVCRHRGTRICREPSGRFGETIQCSYHAWTYGTDGRLVGAPHMQEVEGFDKSAHGLHAATLAEWEGFLFVNVARDPEPFEAAWAPMRGKLSRYDLPRLEVGHQVVYDVGANWKLVIQNYSECLHCPAIHPALQRLSHYMSGDNEPPRPPVDSFSTICFKRFNA
jgi:Rieske 2Fe-2S family protein